MTKYVFAVLLTYETTLHFLIGKLAKVYVIGRLVCQKYAVKYFVRESKGTSICLTFFISILQNIFSL